jgi:tRNA-2-methylthio-N6-dimethylallyladenosine synthase
MSNSEPKNNNFFDSDTAINPNSSFYIETYGCQMNVSDSEVVYSILSDHSFQKTTDIHKAGLILINTCSIRENAEQRVMGRLEVFRQAKQKHPDIMVGVIGCMAERLKEKLLDNDIVDIVAGPDSYRYLPALIKEAREGKKAINIELSKEETYKDIMPVRLDQNGVSAFISIMRGCNNFCAYCVVPYTRGRERSRDYNTILKEVVDLEKKGYKEVTLLGQNVNSYAFEKDNKVVSFALLMEMIAKAVPDMRIRFATSHPKDISDELLHTIARYPNICKHIHLPCQSGSTKILKKMNRRYTREWYMQRIEAIRAIVPDCAITTDIIAGFSGETADDHQETLSLMKWVKYDSAFTFRYSLRPNTAAAEKYEDDVAENIKIERLNEIINLQQSLSAENNRKYINKTCNVLIEGVSKKSDKHFFGRTTHNKVVVFPKEGYKIGEYAKVMVTDCTAATLIGHVV